MTQTTSKILPANSPKVIVDLQFISPLWEKRSTNFKKICGPLVRHVLAHLDPSILPPVVPKRITIVLSDDAHLQTLNATYRQQNKPTNILSFAYGPEALSQGHLGDLFLSFECLQREADAQQKSMENHFSHLIVHGILHLLGYDHEDPTEALEMESLEIQLLQKMHIPNPYEDYFGDNLDQNLTYEV